MESGFYVLEGYFEIQVLNARHIINVPGHKTDKKDSEWIAKLMLSGLLKSSFAPKADIRFVRTNALNKVNQLSRRFMNYFYYYSLTLFGVCILLANTRTIPGKKN